MHKHCTYLPGTCKCRWKFTIFFNVVKIYIFYKFQKSVKGEIKAAVPRLTGGLLVCIHFSISTDKNILSCFAHSSRWACPPKRRLSQLTWLSCISLDKKFSFYFYFIFSDKISIWRLVAQSNQVYRQSLLQPEKNKWRKIKKRVSSSIECVLCTITVYLV